jgi:S1-C subfamily serine protease
VAGPSAGFWGSKVKPDERKQLGLPADSLAVRVMHIWADHARQAGVRNGDVVVEIDGVRRDMTIRQLHAHLQLHRDFGDAISLAVLRDGKRQELQMQLPKTRPALE